MPRLTLALVALAGLLAGGLGMSLLNRTPSLSEGEVRTVVGEALAAQPAAAPMTEDQVKAIVADALAAQPQPIGEDAIRAIVATALADQDANAPMSLAQLDPAQLNPMIESYLMNNPKLLQRMSEALNSQLETERRVADAAGIARLKDAIYNDPDHIVVGNPDGDVTLVEMFDYNCGYCRGALPDLATLIAEDPNLKVILKEFPILSQGSVDAARVAVVVNRDKNIDYWDFHQKLFTSRGQVTKDAALKVAQDLGMNPVQVGLEMEGKDVDAVLANSFKIADGLGVSGTPTYIIGNEVIPGAIGIDGLRERIANIRACGETKCPS